MNSQNLVPNSERTPEQRKTNATKAGRASGAARRRKKDLRMALEILLDKKYPQYDKNGNLLRKVSGTEAITAKLFEQAMKGNIKAFETIRATVGQDPVQKVMVAEVEQSVIDEVERAVLGE